MLGPADFTDYRKGWAPSARETLGMTPAGQYGVWRVWWHKFVRSIPDEVAS